MTNPELMEEWDFKKNVIKPSEVSSKANVEIWWICKKCQNSWQTFLANRTKGHGCKKCSGSNESKIGKSITLEGIKYPSISKAAIAYSLPRGTVESRYKSGWCIEEIFGISDREKTKI